MSASHKRLGTELLVVNMKEYSFKDGKSFKGFGIFDLEQFAFVSYDGVKPYVLAAKQVQTIVAKTMTSIPNLVKPLVFAEA